LVSNAGGALPLPLVANTPYYVINLSGTTLKLALSVDLAQAGTAIDLTTDGTGTNTLLAAMGAAYGEGVHTLTIPEMPAHKHDVSSTGASIGSATNGPYFLNVADVFGTVTATNIGLQGGGLPANNMQPTLFTNIFIKL
jgi:microcystin-dependent protein